MQVAKIPHCLGLDIKEEFSIYGRPATGLVRNGTGLSATASSTLYDASRQIPEMAPDGRWTYGNDRRNLS